jgi:hypothetical protein
MKHVKVISFCFLLSLMLMACSKKDTPPDNSQTVIQQATNINEPVKAGETNCSEAISGKIKLKASGESSGSGAAVSVKINSKTEKLYPSGGYILVYELKRTGSSISLNYKQVNTSCGNPAAAAMLPATSAPVIDNLVPGTYPIQIIVNGTANKGVLVVPPAPGSPALQMETTNGIVIE